MVGNFTLNFGADVTLQVKYCFYDMLADAVYSSTIASK